ncbi:MAG: 2-C-methyl-D-erythritol 4-phosphate cytidylyltransferase [Dehalococcoidia bacterium]|nr:2-C-methyl-D-erythritol 4-phosphate cytidylyltransferase [Dehalococcoidia bacterium]
MPPDAASGHDTATVAILLAAGDSARFGDADKLWADLGGEPLVAHPLRALAALPEVNLLVVVAPVQRHAALRALAAPLDCELRLVAGGARRRDSVAAGIAAAPGAGWYLVHDAARPLTSAELARRVLAAARAHGAAVPVLPVVDTLKRVDAVGRVLGTANRDELRAAQTPQAFAGALLRRAHAAEDGGADATDDAALVERLGEAVWTVEGDPANLKVTAPGDLALVRALLGRREAGGR